MAAFVAFYRNVNLGQRGSPTRQQLESAFLQSGAQQASSFMSNGSLVFMLADSQDPRQVTDQANLLLAEACGLKEPAFISSLEHLAALVAEDPFRAYRSLGAIECSQAFFAPLPGEHYTVPLESPRKDCLVFRIDPGQAFAIRWQALHGLGYPTPILEKALARPVTTRNWNTIVRLVAKYAPGNNSTHHAEEENHGPAPK